MRKRVEPCDGRFEQEGRTLCEGRLCLKFVKRAEIDVRHWGPLLSREEKMNINKENNTAKSNSKFERNMLKSSTFENRNIVIIWITRKREIIQTRLIDKYHQSTKKTINSSPKGHTRTILRNQLPFSSGFSAATEKVQRPRRKASRPASSESEWRVTRNTSGRTGDTSGRSTSSIETISVSKPGGPAEQPGTALQLMPPGPGWLGLGQQRPHSGSGCWK